MRWTTLPIIPASEHYDDHLDDDVLDILDPLGEDIPEPKEGEHE
jgi:hypothetical protein